MEVRRTVTGLVVTVAAAGAVALGAAVVTPEIYQDMGPAAAAGRVETKAPAAKPTIYQDM